LQKVPKKLGETRLWQMFTLFFKAEKKLKCQYPRPAPFQFNRLGFSGGVSRR